jgi:pteridine reductase
MRPTALVTGAAKRVGRAIALELGRAGLDVGVHYRSSQDAAEEVVAEIEAAGGQAFSVQADLSLASEIGALVDTVKRRWQHLDLLVHNASTFEPVPFEQITTAKFDEMMAVNVRAPFILSRECTSLLREKGGLVVHMCDIGGERPMSGYAHYSVSKSAMSGLVKAMAVELGPTIRSVGIAPGQVMWPPNWDASYRKKMTDRIPMGRVGKPEDVARLVRFLLEEGTYINGEIITLDGGLSARY